MMKERAMEAAGQFALPGPQSGLTFITPLLRFLVTLCLAMSLMLFMERLYMALVIVFVKLFGKKAEERYKWEAIGNDDVEAGSSAYPMVLVQIPMHNEKEVYKLSIAAACGLSWPSDRVIVQVLDDSTDPVVMDLIKRECERWADKGANIKYETREDRVGFKAGSLKKGMKHSYVKQCEYVAIFDADFQPESDFLVRTIPFLVHNSEIALVQARWTFVNADECLLTRMQEISLNYHFIVEQEAGSSTYAFFGFNGTAGVWRISALNDAGGWKGRTTVEDMDLAVRASLQGWKFVYVSDLKVKSELPSTYNAYCHQQHRWSCGPANLFRKTALEIATSNRVSFWEKLYLIYSFFFVRKIVAHIVTFTFYCLVLPATVLFPEVVVPKWGAVYLPAMVTILNAVTTPRSFHLVFFWVLFENVMSMLRTKATIMGLLEAGEVNEWVVTQKLGDALKDKLGDNVLETRPVKIASSFSNRLNLKAVNLWELVMGCYLFICGCYDFSHGRNHFFAFLFLQAIAFFIAGFGYIGTFFHKSKN
uniref:glucomannan 4-beta-mannosyltransferase n=1 Tax=Kalanchoe fedtschenkoi TaxID=63787 RepID=A0A7N1A783_KALFE